VLTKNPDPEASIMTRRHIRNRRSFGLESLEIRNAPSHFGMAAQVAAVAHSVRPVAHVRHISDSEVNHQKELTEKSSSVDSSQDGSKDQSNDSSSSNDRSSVDLNSQR
jgi:hypothetical protein